MRACGILVAASVALLAGARPAVAQDESGAHALRAVPLADPELAQLTGKFVLPNGVELALSVTSDTVVNGQLILRTVLTVDHGTQLQVLGRNQGSGAATAYAGTPGATPGVAPSGIAVSFDRQSGIQTVTPTFSVTQGASSNVTLGAAPQTPESLGLSALPLTPGGAPVTTADGVVSLQAVRNGTQVTLIGDQLAVANLVGQSIATAVVNSANNRMLDTVTNVAIDLRNVAPYQIGSAQMRVDTLALDASRGLVR